MRKAGRAVWDVVTGDTQFPTIGDIPTVPPGTPHPEPAPRLPQPEPIPTRSFPSPTDLRGHRGGTGLVPTQPRNGDMGLPPLPPPPNGLSRPPAPVELELQFQGGAEEGRTSEDDEIEILQAALVPFSVIRAFLMAGREILAKAVALVRRNPGTSSIIAGMTGAQAVAWIRQQPDAQVSCPSGHRPNKTSYFLRDGTFVLKGTRCVKSRRRNPLNPRAADRAMGRLEAGKRAVQRFSRFSIRKKKC